MINTDFIIKVVRRLRVGFGTVTRVKSNSSSPLTSEGLRITQDKVLWKTHISGSKVKWVR